MPSVRHILCPVDFSEDSQRALRYTAALTRGTRGCLTVLTVTDPLLAQAAVTYALDPTGEQADAEPPGLCRGVRSASGLVALDA